jgi:NADPH-dependent 2,4-dienoyl-CoA reductase/sulfur reductase-like enzyme/nitrite reductase/ring-hydroxylating ferredoxin subunit
VTEPSGPDLSIGIDAGSIRPGEKLLGHVKEEAVLVARLDNDLVAISARCTHYGGPLADGVVDGDTVRCPWHHACFSLRTGEALRAPALDPVACWKVERRGEKAVVAGKIERDPLSPSYPAPIGRAPSPQDVVIIGAGAAGSAATEMLRRCGHDGRIAVVDDDSGAPYDRPNLSKDYLAGTATEEWIPLRPDGFYEKHGVSLMRGRVTRLDTTARAVAIDGHGSISYDALLIATGAEPVRINLAGDVQPHVHYLRSLTDSRAIVEASKSARRVVVIGGSFIGLEVAASMRARNLEVHVVAPDKIPLARVLGEHLGSFIRALHEEHGVVFHLGHTPRRIEREAVVLDDGARLEADLVVIGVGVRPRLDLAEQAGLAMDKGIAVNEYLEASVPGVFAAGDIARWPDRHSGERIRVEHWVVAERQGQAAARNILGARERFDQVPFFWSAHYDLSINYVGHAEKWDRVEVSGDASKHDVAVRFIREGKLLALATLFRDEESLRAEIEMERANS